MTSIVTDSIVDRTLVRHGAKGGGIDVENQRIREVVRNSFSSCVFRTSVIQLCIIWFLIFHPYNNRNMQKTSSSWQLEDTFFGAILGAVLGIFIDKLPIWYIAIMILYFIIFPLTLRKAEAHSKNAYTIVIIALSTWITFLVFDLHNQNIIPMSKGLVFVVIVLGWIASLTLRSQGKST